MSHVFMPALNWYRVLYHLINSCPFPVLFRIGKGLFIRVFLSVYEFVCASFPFGFESDMWNFPEHCLLFTFNVIHTE